MRAELPWNVAGIPPEARAAARAAARREGLSVGEWLTRRILRSFSDLGEDAPAAPYDRSVERSVPLDPWGLPAASASHRDTEDMLNQLASHVVSIHDRLGRAADQDGLKDAVKGLHLGLSRLADQISQAANQSAQQVAAISGNLEQMAGWLGQVRTEFEATTRRLEARVSAIEEKTNTGISAFDAEIQRNLDQRLVAVEKSVQFNTNALEQLEAQAGIRAGDQAELQKRHAETDGAISRIEESIKRLEAHNDDPAMERRLDSIERALGSLVSRMETYDPAAPLEDILRGLVRRIDTVEKNHGEMMDELRANLAGGGKPTIAAAEPPYDPALFDPKSFDARPIAAPESNFKASPFAEPVPPFNGDHPGFAATDAPPLAEDPFAAEVENNRGSRLGFARGSPSATAAGAKPLRSSLTVPLIVTIVIVLALFAGVVLGQKLNAGHPTAPAAPQAAHFT